MEEKTIYDEILEVLKKMGYRDDICEEIAKVVQDNTNRDYAFDYYFDYRDEVDEDDLNTFITSNRNKFEDLDEAKCELRQYLEEKYNMRDSEFYYYDELASKISEIEVEDKGITCEYVDGSEVVRTLQDELGILYCEYDMLDICKGRYRIAICSTKCHDLFTTCFFDGKYKDEDRLVDGQWKTLPSYWKEDIQSTKDEYLLQKLCKVHGFDIEDIFKYQMSEDEQRREKYPGIRDNNKFFDDLYTELCNTFGYAEDLRFLTNMDIDELLQFTIKDTKYDLYNTSYFGFYDHINGSGSMFDGKINKNCEVDTKDLEVYLFSRVNYFESCYGFTSKAFGL